jgi:hypothetical protein
MVERHEVAKAVTQTRPNPTMRTEMSVTRIDLSRVLSVLGLLLSSFFVLALVVR